MELSLAAMSISAHLLQQQSSTQRWWPRDANYALICRTQHTANFRHFWTHWSKHNIASVCSENVTMVQLCVSLQHHLSAKAMYMPFNDFETRQMSVGELNDWYGNTCSLKLLEKPTWPMINHQLRFSVPLRGLSPRHQIKPSAYWSTGGRQIHPRHSSWWKQLYEQRWMFKLSTNAT